MPQEQMYNMMAPTMGGIFSGNPYQVPDIGMMMPSAENMSNIDPNIMAGILQPYKLGEQQLMETLGGRGQMGSARGGFSGAGAAGLGKYWGTAAPQIGTSMWNMISPQLRAGWDANLDRNRFPSTFAMSQMPSIYPSPVVHQPTEKASSMDTALGWAMVASQFF